MNSTSTNDWKHVREIFDGALREPVELRAKFISDACGEDAGLRREIESLVSSHDSAETFLETPAVVQVVENFNSSENLLAEGQILGHYEVQELIGSGGMGEVYLGRDTRLNRKVAIKILRTDFLPNGQTNRRLLREARAAALLEHPNICQIYEIAETDKHSFIVMQYVVGTTLADIFVRERLTIGTGLDLILQILDGLAEAHANGVIHRDIKPANVMVTEKGQAKILDFGLAKFIEAETMSETAQRLNSSGSVMGTIPFMSPEQLRGKAVDQRTDVFSVGSLLYEMLTGEPAFTRENNAETIAAVLNDDPDLSGIPEALHPILARSLQKEIGSRYASADELAKDIRDVRDRNEFDESLHVASTTATRRRARTDSGASKTRQFHFRQSAEDARRSSPQGATEITDAMDAPGAGNKAFRIAAGISAVLLLTFVAVVVWQKFGDGNRRSSFDAMRAVRLVQWRSGASSNNTDYRVSHDGKFVAYSSSRHGSDEVIYLKQTGDGEEIRVTRDEWRNISPVWSPDDQRIAFVSVRENEPGIYTVPSLGGNATPLLITERANISLRQWSDDGGSIFYEEVGNLYRLDIDTKNVSKVTDLPDSTAGNDRYFSISPDGSEIVYCDTRDGQRDLWIVPISGREPRRLTNDSDEEHRPIWHPDGRRILYNVSRNGFAQVSVVHTTGGDPVQVTRGEGNYELIDISPDGLRIYYTNWEKRSDISAVNVGTGEESEVATGIEAEMWPDVSPDSKSVAYLLNGSTNPTADLQSSSLMIRSTDGRSAPVVSNAYDARWLPDGRHIAFLRWNDAERRDQLWIANTINSQERQVTTEGVTPPSLALMPIARSGVAEYDFSRDGRSVVFVDSQKPRNVRIATIDGSSPAGSVKIAEGSTGVRYSSPRFSPDGNTIAFEMIQRSSTSRVMKWTVAFARGTDVRPVSIDGSVRLIAWDPSGTSVVMLRVSGPIEVGPGNVDILRVTAEGSMTKLTSLDAVYADSITLSPDGNSLALTARRNDKDDIWIFPINGGEPQRISNNGNTRIFYANLAWSPDSKTIYFDKQDQINTISMFENFR